MTPAGIVTNNSGKVTTGIAELGIPAPKEVAPALIEDPPEIVAGFTTILACDAVEKNNIPLANKAMLNFFIFTPPQKLFNTKHQVI